MYSARQYQGLYMQLTEDSPLTYGCIKEPYLHCMRKDITASPAVNKALEISTGGHSNQPVQVTPQQLYEYIAGLNINACSLYEGLD
jgi:hypothetical protein